MPRQARLDAPRALHHVIVRGPERSAMPREWTYEPFSDGLPWPGSA